MNDRENTREDRYDIVEMKKQYKTTVKKWKLDWQGRNVNNRKRFA
jgi:hypothetical protein